MQPLKPICNERKIRKNGTSLIFIQYCFSSDNRVTLNSEIAIPPKYWDKKRMLIRSTLPKEFGEVEELMSQLKYKVRQAEDLADLATKKKVADKGKFVKDAFDQKLTVEELEEDQDKFKELIGGEKKETTDVNLDVYFQIDEYIKTKEKKVTEATINVFGNIKAHLKAFEEFRKNPITFESFDFNFYDNFVDFLTFDYVQPRFKKNPVVGLKVNTIGKTIKQLKIFIKDRIKRKIISPIDLTDYKVPEEETDAIYLNYAEIAQIYHTDLSKYPDLIPYRDLFVLACLTGLRFSDFSSIQPEDVRHGMLHKKQEKSDHWVVIPLREEAQEIFYKQFSQGIPFISNADFNEKIKIVGKLAGIDTPIKFKHKKGNKDIEVLKAKCDWITSHTARRSFCTNEFLAGTPVKLIMQISGHKREKDFYRYIRISPEEAAEIIKKLWMERNNMQAFGTVVKMAS